jgi:hypothetical protein
MTGSPSPVTVLAWYDRNQWERLKQVAADADQLDDTYEEWLANAKRFRGDLVLRGLQVVKIDIDVDELSTWCATHRMPNTSEARSQFAAEIAAKRDAQSR